MNTEEQNQDQDQNQNQNEGGKVKKKFDSAMAQLNAVLQGNKDIYSKKIGNEAVSGIVEELLKERSKKAVDDFKKEASELIDKVIEYEDFINKKRKEFESAEAQKMKELTAEINKVIGKIQNVGELHRKYAATLNKGQNPVATEVEDNN